MKASIESEPLQGKKRFYHFTCEARIPSIIHHGIDRGAVPVTPLHAVNFPWLTTDPDPACLIEITEPLDDNGQRILPSHLSKTGVRLEVELGADDPKLTMWQPYAKRLRVREPFYEFFTERPKWGVEWHVYRGAIGFEKVTNAYFPTTGKTLMAEELKAHYCGGEQTSEPWRAPVVMLSEAEAMKLARQDFDLGEDPMLIKVLMYSQFPPQSVEMLREYAQSVRKMCEVTDLAS